MISLEKLKILAPTQKLPKTVGDLSKLIVAKGFKKLPKVQKIAKSGHAGLMAMVRGGVFNTKKCFNDGPYPGFFSISDTIVLITK